MLYNIIRGVKNEKNIVDNLEKMVQMIKNRGIDVILIRLKPKTVRVDV